MESCNLNFLVFKTDFYLVAVQEISRANYSNRLSIANETMEDEEITERERVSSLFFFFFSPSLLWPVNMGGLQNGTLSYFLLCTYISIGWEVGNCYNRFMHLFSYHGGIFEVSTFIYTNYNIFFVYSICRVCLTLLTIARRQLPI